MRKYNDVELQEKDGMIAVLVSPGFGAGWSTWNSGLLAYDKRVIELFDQYPPEQEEDGLKEIESKLADMGYSDVYMGGYNQIKKQWIPIGTPFRIHEYDGSEHIQVADEIGLIVF